jgi:integrase
MSDIAKRKRGGTLLTDRLCETRPDRRKKYYDRKCTGLYVSITTKGVATFSCNFTNAAGRPTSGKVGIYHPKTFKVADARAKVMALKAKGGASIGELLSQQKAEQATLGVTVDYVIAKRVDWMKTLVKKDDHEMRPRVESWRNVEQHLLRFVAPRFGRKIASEVSGRDIATLSNDIASGTYIANGKVAKPSTANARHMRRATTAMFKWAALEGNNFVLVSPCVNLPPLDKEPPKTRGLSEHEVRTLWHGLDREDLPWDRRTRLALKFALVTMLRSGELLPIHRDELNAENGTVDIPARRVKKRRVINQSLSDLALEIITEAMGNYEYAFTGRFGDAPLSRQAMSGALTGTKVTKNGKRVTRTPGICELLGLKPFTPHDLRRTAATMAGELDLSGAAISLCLDHQPTKDEDGNPMPAVTTKVYNLATKIKVAKKRKVLDAWAVELRRIIGKASETELRLVA